MDPGENEGGGNLRQGPTFLLPLEKLNYFHIFLVLKWADCFV